MKTFTPVVALMVVVLVVAPAFGDDESKYQRTLLEDAIDTEIAQSRQKASLMTSRSANLRKEGHRAASKAMYLETHRDELVVDMMKVNLEPKTYKVERYLNERFSCDCYSNWMAVGD
jgi:hypothetical protein